MERNISIRNRFNEKLDTLVEGDDDAKITIVFVHGFGTDKHETAGLFDDLASSLKDKFRIVRFDFAGFGESEGRDIDADYVKEAGDLRAILDWTRQNFAGKIFILAMSMGCFVTAQLLPEHIEKIVLLSIPNSNSQYNFERIKQKFFTRPGAIFDEFGISSIPRSTGKIQKRGPNFWKVLKNFHPLDKIKKLSKKTDLLIIHPKQDDVVGNEFMNEYKSIAGVTFIEVDGGHSFKDSNDRINMIKVVKEFYGN